MSARSKWLDWKPSSQGPSILETTAKYELTKTTETAPITGKTPRTEPTETTETIFGVFVASPLAISQKIEAGPQTHAFQCESDTSRECKPAEICPDSDLDTPAPSSLKGQAVELWRDGRRFFLVSDEQDAQEIVRRLGAHRGEVWTGAELELVCPIQDQATRDEMEAFKRQSDGCLSPSTAGKGVSAAEWQAQMLNQFFKEQGVTREPGRITAATVRHGERKRRGEL
jgi:hypothetical protein